MKTKNINELNKKGYIIIKNKYNSMEKLKEIFEIIKKQSNNATYIFNNKINDKKRKQCRLNIKTKIIKEYVETIKKSINDNLDLKDTKYKKWIILKSLDNCKSQIPHLDYIPTDNFINMIKNNNSSYFFINAIEKTQIYTYGKYLDNKHKKRKIIIQPNSILLMRSDLIHAGSDFDKENIRLHCYIETPYIPMKYNKIYKIENLKE
jgi:hypothetical protein